MYKLKVLVDANVLLDGIFEKESHHGSKTASRIVGLCVQDGKIQGYLAAHVFYDVCRVINEHFAPSAAGEKIQFLYRSFDILTLDRKTAIRAIELSVAGKFDDSLLAYSADSEKMDFIVTSDVDKFQCLMHNLPKSLPQRVMAKITNARVSKVKILTPEGFMQMAESIGYVLDLTDNWGLIYKKVKEDSKNEHPNIVHNAIFDDIAQSTQKSIANAFTLQRRA